MACGDARIDQLIVLPLYYCIMILSLPMLAGKAHF